MKQMATQIQDGNLSFEMQGVNQTDMYWSVILAFYFTVVKTLVC